MPILDSRVPIGTIKFFGGGTVPPGFLMCDGSTLSRAVYAALFAVLGTTFGAPDGSTFLIPDFRGKVPVGDGQDTANGLSNRTIGQFFGEEVHILSVGEMPSHGHSVGDPGHSHGVPHSAGVSPTPSGTVGHDVDNGWNQTIYTLASSTNIYIQNSGGSGPHNNVQPSLVCRFIIRF